VRRSTAASVAVALAAGCQSGTVLFRETEADRLTRKERAYVACLNTFRAECPMPDIGPCKRGLRIARRWLPRMEELEAAGDAYVAALEQLAPRCLEGTVTPEVREAFAAADRALLAEVDAIEDRIQELTLADLDAGSVEARRLRVLIEAKRVARGGAPDALAAAVDALAPDDTLAAPARALLEAAHAGDRARVRDAYNSLIDTSNRMEL
jgi:hypothetical protein